MHFCLPITNPWSELYCEFTIFFSSRKHVFPLLFFSKRTYAPKIMKKFTIVFFVTINDHEWLWIFFSVIFFLFSILLDFWIKFINSLSKTEKNEWIYRGLFDYFSTHNQWKSLLQITKKNSILLIETKRKFLPLQLQLLHFCTANFLTF